MCHVLVIEDDWLIADHLVGIVEANGATSVVQAETEQGAIEAARERRPEIILSDVRLATGTGPLAVQAILAELGEIPVIFVTGSPEDCKPCAPPGIILDKPIVDATVRGAFRHLAFGEEPPAALRDRCLR